LINNDLLARYALGDLSQEERQRVERERLIDNEMREVIENDLIDSYVRGALSPPLRQLFEERFLDTPEKRHRVEVAGLFMDPALRARVASPAIETLAKGGVRSFPWAHNWATNPIAALAGLAMVGCTWLALQNRHLRAELHEAQEQQVLRRQIDDLRRQLADRPAAAGAEKESNSQAVAGPLTSRPASISILLAPGLLRHGGANRRAHLLTIPAGVSYLVVRLSLQRSDYPAFVAILETADGRQIRRIQGLTSIMGPRNREVDLSLPAQLLAEDEYIVTLSGVGADGKIKVLDLYSLTVAR
jgi:anti-sigma-K factor RskA